MKISQECRFFYERQCVDADECLYNHNTDNLNKQHTPRKRRFKIDTDFCKDGVSCARIDCEYSDDKHRRIRDVPCKFQENCKKQACPFRHNEQLNFHKNRNLQRKK